MELFNLAVDIGSKGGAWYTFTSVDETPKFQGSEKARDFIVNNPTVYDNLVSEVSDTLEYHDIVNLMAVLKMSLRDISLSDSYNKSTHHIRARQLLHELFRHYKF